VIPVGMREDDCRNIFRSDIEFFPQLCRAGFRFSYPDDERCIGILRHFRRDLSGVKKHISAGIMDQQQTLNRHGDFFIAAIRFDQIFTAEQCAGGNNMDLHNV
jgi:hypothetical protein